MRRIVIAAAAAAGAVVSVTTASPASAQPAPAPYVDHVEWAKWADLSSLRVFPTEAGRKSSGLGTDALGEEAWAEVLALSPDADLPGMKQQFFCHWNFAELSEPGKRSWNLEPFRPVVSDQEMVQAGCNPGNVEEPF